MNLIRKRRTKKGEKVCAKKVREKKEETKVLEIGVFRRRD